ncbi:hypothetical protein EB061_12975, partial [bacterium]|nr:hypothetical protein [bacterium]
MKNYSELKAQALKLPHLPGVYQYKNQAGDIIYIGKAKDLHKRVNSYFKNNSDLKTSLLLDQIATIEYSVTPTEIDALTLEDQLIRAYQPRYNILLKTDSSYRYICLSKTNPPKITTNRKPVKNLYCFGPFPFATNQIVTIARDILGLTKYQQLAAPNWELYLDAANFSKNKPANFLNEKVYQNFIDQLIKTIKHGDQKLILDYQNKMAEHAKKLEFEQALQYKQKIELLNKFTQRTSDLNQKKNSNQQLIIVIEQQNKACIFIFNIQHGLLHAVQNFKFDLRQNNLQDILEAFLKQYYANHLPPAEILLHIQIPKLINNLQIDLAISDYLT